MLARPMAAAGAAALAVLALTGCGAEGRGTGNGGGTASPSRTVDCGTVTLGQGESSIPETALACLADASRAGSPATLAVLTPTTEGDPITRTYTGRVRMVVDTTQDAFAGDGAGITQQTCDLGTSGGQITVTNCSAPQPV